MDAELTAQLIVNAITNFIHSHDEHRRHLTSSSPLKRPVGIRTDSWILWLRDGGRPGTTSYVGPIDEDRATRALELLHELPELAGEGGADRVIDRPQLVALSESAAKRGSAHERRCIALWLASMMWGSGTTNGRGPWRTAHGLSAPGLGQILTESHRALRAGDPFTAYQLAKGIPGSGEAAFTRWLWAASLGLELPVKPLPFDLRLRNAMETVIDDAGVMESRVGSGARDFLACTDAIHVAAATLRKQPGFRGTTPEKVHWLLREQW